MMLQLRNWDAGLCVAGMARCRRRDQSGEGMPMVIALLGAGLIVGALLYFVAGPPATSRQSAAAVMPSAEEVAAQQAFLTASNAFFQLSSVERDEKVARVLASVRDSLQEKEFTQGLESLDALLLWTNAPALRELRVDLLFAASRLNEALLELKRLLQLKPEEAPLHVAAANMARNLEGVSASIPFLETAARLSPQNASYQLALARTYLEAGNAVQGTNLFERLLQEDPNSMECWYGYGDALAQRGRTEASVAVFRRAVAAHEDNFRHHYHLGLALEYWNRSEPSAALRAEAVTHYRRSLELNPLRDSVAAQRILELTGERVPPELERLTEQEFPLEVYDGVQILRIRVNGIEGTFVLDTGASETSLFGDVLERYKLQPTLRMVESQTANGRVQCPLAYATVGVGPFQESGAPIVVIPARQPGKDPREMKFDGLFGSGFLQRFGGRIDVGRGRLILRGPRE